jgi:hypothetical protein
MEDALNDHSIRRQPIARNEAVPTKVDHHFPARVIDWMAGLRKVGKDQEPRCNLIGGSPSGRRRTLRQPVY